MNYSEIESKLMATITEPMLAKIRLNSGQYRALKAVVFTQLYSVGSKREPVNPLAGVKIEVDDNLTEVEYYDQHNNRMRPSC